MSSKGGKPEYLPIIYCDMKKAVDVYSPADICFICDTTGSMDIYKEKIRNILKNFINGVTEIMSSPPRVSFIGFKDKLTEDSYIQLMQAFEVGIIEEPHMKDELDVQDFTNDVDLMEKFIDNINCFGGDDQCEDVIPPLKRALSLD